jgi:hypothetical protein
VSLLQGNHKTALHSVMEQPEAVMAKRKRMTAEELMAQLAADPEFVAREAAEEEERLEVEAQLTRAEAPLLRDLKAAGAQLESVWDLVNTCDKYPKFVPILLAHLERDYPDKIREGIARALAVPGARIGWKQLVRLFAAELSLDEGNNPSQVKWALHLAIAAAADESVVDELIALAANRRHGHDRSFFVDALFRINDPRARAAIEELEDDPDLAEAFKRIANKKRRRR